MQTSELDAGVEPAASIAWARASSRFSQAATREQLMMAMRLLAATAADYDVEETSDTGLPLNPS